MIVEDRLRVENPESYRRLRDQTAVPIAVGEKLDTRKNPCSEIITGSLAGFDPVPFTIRFRNVHVDWERRVGPEKFLRVSS